jgi:polysaccharide export outer membrane protein
MTKARRLPRFVRCVLLSAFLVLLVVDTSPAFAADTPYRPGSGDVLSITAFGQQGLSGRFKVSVEGTISYPLLGEIGVANLTGPEIEAKIQQLLAEQVPGVGRVSVEVAEYAPVYILGDVEHPGHYEFRPGMIALELVALGGGIRHVVLDGQRDPTLQLITLEQELADQRLVRYAQGATRARLLAERESDNFAGTIPSADDQPIMAAQKTGIVENEQALFRVRAEVLANREKTLREQRNSFSQEIGSLTESIKLHDVELELINQELNTAQGLVDRGLTTEPRVLALKRQVAATKRSSLELQSFLARAHERQSAVDLQIEELHNTRANEIAQALRDINIEIARSDEKLSATSATLAAMRESAASPSAKQPSPTRFDVVRLVEGAYRTLAIGERDRLEPRDILQVSRQPANPERTAMAPQEKPSSDGSTEQARTSNQ